MQARTTKEAKEDQEKRGSILNKLSVRKKLADILKVPARLGEEAPTHRGS